MSGSPLETAVLTSFALWFGFYLLNHASITERARAAVLARLPAWAVELLSCSLCCAWWSLVASGLLFGFHWTHLFTVPPMTLFIDLVYRRLIAGNSK